MFQKYNRTNFIEVVEVDGIKERDLLLSNWEMFIPKRGIRYTYLDLAEVARPDILSVKLYGRSDWWWIIAKYNQIDDWWNDAVEGLRVGYVYAEDIEDFYMAVKHKFSNTVI